MNKRTVIWYQFGISCSKRKAFSGTNLGTIVPVQATTREYIGYRRLARQETQNKPNISKF
jgi:hypothetical protein